MYKGFCVDAWKQQPPFLRSKPHHNIPLIKCKQYCEERTDCMAIRSVKNHRRKTERCVLYLEKYLGAGLATVGDNSTFIPMPDKNKLSRSKYLREFRKWRKTYLRRVRQLDGVSPGVWSSQSGGSRTAKNGKKVSFKPPIVGGDTSGWQDDRTRFMRRWKCYTNPKYKPSTVP